MGDLSENFSKREFKCPDCGDSYINENLVQSLQSVRNALGKPLFILSAFRCGVWNTRVGGSKRSQHLLGKAVDITCPFINILNLYHLVLEIPEFFHGGVGFYPQSNFLHVDVRGKKARWGRVNGKYVGVKSAISYWKEYINVSR